MVLTFNEAEVVDAVRRRAVAGVPVPARLVRMAVWDSHRIPYDAAHRALTGLVKKGLLTKPSRGYYLPADV